MTNQERQKSLDKKRTREQLGIMPYCNYCDKRYMSVNIGEWGCWATSQDRQEQCLCAKAYNRMQRSKGEGK